MADNGANGTTPTLDELKTSLDGLWLKHAAAVEKRSLTDVTAVTAEMKRVQKSIEDFQVNAEKSARDELLPKIADALGKFQFPTNLQLSGTVKRDNQGKFTDMAITLSPVENTALYNALTKVLPTGQLESLGSVKGIKFLIAGGDAEVEYTGARSAGSGTGGGGGKGWVKDGQVRKLAEIFSEVATAEEQAEYDAKSGDGSAQYTVKTKVVKAAGYTLNQ